MAKLLSQPDTSPYFIYPYIERRVIGQTPEGDTIATIRVPAPMEDKILPEYRHTIDYVPNSLRIEHSRINPNTSQPVTDIIELLVYRDGSLNVNEAETFTLNKRGKLVGKQIRVDLSEIKEISSLVNGATTLPKLDSFL